MQSVVSPTPTSSPLPVAPPMVASSRVNPRDFIAKGTALHASVAILGLVLMLLVTAVITWGIAIILWIVGGVIYLTRVNKARAALRGSALRVGPDQFPEIHTAAELLSGRLGLKEAPEVYIMDGAQPNALATKIGQRQYVVLFDDVIHGAESASNPHVLDFILAHELAHHALGHTGMIRGSMSANYKALSRCDEFSCDAVAHALIGDAAAAREAFTLLMVGPHVFTRVNAAGLSRQIQEVAADKNSRRAEKTLRMTHPLIFRRLARIEGKIKI